MFFDRNRLSASKVNEGGKKVGRFVMLSGPSCVGKGPLYSALKTFYPELAGRLKQIVLYNSRSPRPGEQEGRDYHFRPLAEIEELARQPGYVGAKVRGDFQCLEVAQIERILADGLDPFFEGNPFIPARLRESKALGHIPMVTTFLAPLSREEVLFLKAPERRVDLGAFLTDVMRRKLLRRTARQKGLLSLIDLEDIERRAASAIVELRHAWKFDRVIPNHDGEDSENWNAFYYPISDARNALAMFAAILRGEAPAGAEQWEDDLVPA
jgi:guanylate kinase